MSNTESFYKMFNKVLSKEATLESPMTPEVLLDEDTMEEEVQVPTVVEQAKPVVPVAGFSTPGERAKKKKLMDDGINKVVKDIAIWKNKTYTQQNPYSSEVLKLGTDHESKFASVGEYDDENELVNFKDANQYRKYFEGQILDTFKDGKVSAESKDYTLRIDNAYYHGKDRYSASEREKAKKNGKSLNRKIKGEYVLNDKHTGEEIFRTNAKTVINVPYHNDDNSYTMNGTEYTMAKQLRLRSGVYSRMSSDGIPTAQFNLMPKSGRPFSVTMNPQSGVYFFKYKKTKIPLMELLKRQGVSDQMMSDVWGEKVFKLNSDYKIPSKSLHNFGEMEEDARKSYARNNGIDVSEVPDDKNYYLEYFKSMRLDPSSTKRTMGVAIGGVDPSVLLQSASKLRALNAREINNDDRDAMAFQNVVDFSDFMNEYISNDKGAIMKQMLWKVQVSQDPDKIPPNLLGKHVSGIVNDSGIANVLSQINPVEISSGNMSVTRLGEGSLSMEGAPSSARAVQPSYLGFVDPLRSPESLKVGLSNFLAKNVRKGKDGQLYTKYATMDGKDKWVSASKAADHVIAFPSEMDKPGKYTTALVNGTKLEIVPKKSVTLQLGDSSDMFDDSTNHIPMLSGVKGMRALMGCLHGDTQLLILRANEVFGTTIANYIFNEGDKIQSLDDTETKIIWRTIRAKKINTDKHDMLEVELKSGRILRTTFNHKWVTMSEYGSLKEILASDLIKGTPIPRVMNQAVINHTEKTKTSDVLWDEVTKVTNIPTEEFTYDLDIDDNVFVAGDGVIVHNSKFLDSALPMAEREAPLVRAMSGKVNAERILGEQSGALRAKGEGRVKSVKEDSITIVYDNGEEDIVNVYKNFPYARKTSLKMETKVKAGQRIKEGSLLTTSNFTDSEGNIALGQNLSVGYIDRKWAFEDAIEISESAAKKLSALRTYTDKYDMSKDHTVDKRQFTSVYPRKFKKEQLSNIDDNGLVKIGTVVKPGDPMYLAIAKKTGELSKLGRTKIQDESSIWEHDFDGVVTDVVKTSDTVKVYVDATVPFAKGDKISIPFGGKGIVSRIIPDDEMPKDKDGKPLDSLMSPLGIISRTNPAQIAVAALGKIARKTGKPYNLKGFTDTSLIEYAQSELEKNGYNKDGIEDVFDPVLNKTLKDVFVGNIYASYQVQTADSKVKSRSTGGYTVDGLPSRGGKSGCFPGTQKVLTLHGERSISSIVEKCQSEQVWTMCDNGKWGFRPIVNWFKYESEVSNMISISSSNAASISGGDRVQHTSVIHPTKNHEIYLFDGSKKLAGELTLDDTLVSWGPEWNPNQKQLLLGSLLGDGYISDNTYQDMHSVKQMDYVAFKQKILSGLYSSWDHIKSEGVTPDGNSHKRCLLTVPNKEIGSRLQEICYRDGKKFVTREWLDQIGELGLVAWFLDDGWISNKGPVKLIGGLCTHGFEKDQVAIIQKWFDDNYPDSVSTSFKEGKCYVISLRKKMCETILNLLAKYTNISDIPRSKTFIRRRVAELQQSITKVHVSGVSKLVKVPAKIISITPYKPVKDVESIPVYDFEVEDTHKYTVSGILVSNSKHLGDMEIAALMGHGSHEFIKDMKLVRGQENSEFWRAVKLGKNPPTPKTPTVYNKFKSYILGSGVNINETSKGEFLYGMTAKQMDKMVGKRKIRTADTFDQKNLRPVVGGLFDPETTGSTSEKQSFAYIELPESLPSPIMEDSLRTLLNYSRKEYAEIVREEGGDYIKDKLAKIDIPALIIQTRKEINSAPSSKRDHLIKKLRVAHSMKSAGVVPTDFMMNKVPVVPPKFRPILQRDGTMMVDDLNYLYRQVINSTKDYSRAKEAGAPDAILKDIRNEIYTGYQSVVGMIETPNEKLAEKEVSGAMRLMLGKKGKEVKKNFIQRRLFGGDTDMTGLGVISPNPNLKLNQVGLPKKKALDLYKPYIIGNLVKKGVSAVEALEMVEKKTDRAFVALKEELEKRPVVINRAPTLHTYSMVSMNPVLVSGNTIDIPVGIESPFNADFDGNCCDYDTMINIRISKSVLEDSYLKGYFNLDDNNNLIKTNK